MKYKKEYIKSNGRKLIGSGPRDLQRRQQQANVVDHSDIIKELKNEINILSIELKERPIVEGFSGEQLDSEIRSVVTEVVKELKVIKDGELERIKEEHSKEIKNLLKEHSEKLEQLTKSIIESGNQNQAFEEQSDNGRPKMMSEFVDPLEEDAGKMLKPFLDVKDASTDEQTSMFGKIDKLKGMLGKLPPQK